MERPWVMGFGPVLLKAGETRRIDAQPKCHFRGETILATYDDDDDADVYLTALFVNRENILQLDSDAISLRKIRIGIERLRWCEPALPIEVEIVNRGARDSTVMLNIMGTARL